MIKRNALRDGVQLSGISVANGRGPQLIELQQVNERAIDLYRDQLPFEELTTINPNRWVKLENGADKLSSRVLAGMRKVKVVMHTFCEMHGVRQCFAEVLRPLSVSNKSLHSPPESASLRRAQPTSGRVLFHVRFIARSGHFRNSR